MSPPKPPSKADASSNDPAVTGYDPNGAWWLNLFKACTGGMSPAGLFHYREDRYRDNEAADCQRCEEYRDFLLQYSPIVTFLRDKVKDLNGDLNASNIVCRRCPAKLSPDGLTEMRKGGGFNPDHGILICANEVRDRSHLEDTLAHEMVHAWDHLRWNMDVTSMRHAACAEIRASMLSGECRFTREFFTRGKWGVSMKFQDCVRGRAIQSLMAREECRDRQHARDAVKEVWDSCYADTRPFDDVYR